jgi:hypothetical protein
MYITLMFGRNGAKGGVTVYEKESPQKHQRDVHRTELIPQRKKSQNASYGLVQWLVFSVTPQDTVRYRRHHVHHVFHKSVHRDRISTLVGSEITLVKGCIHGMK